MTSPSNDPKEELKPCPFCNSYVECEIYHDHQRVYGIVCEICQVGFTANTEQEVIRLWNTRPPAPALRETGETYPTKDAYDAACKALWKHRDKNEQLEAQLSLMQKKMDRMREALAVSLGSFNFIENICLSWDPDERSKNDNVENLYFMESIIDIARKEAVKRIGDESLSTQDQETKEG